MARLIACLLSMKMNEFEDDPETWAYELKKHFDAFSEACWRSFNKACEEMRERGHENKVDRLKWRQVVLWNMQDRHDHEELNS